MNGLSGAVITIKASGLRWRINRAVSMNAARDAIYHAMARGALGLTATSASPFWDPSEFVILAEVKRVEAKP